MNPVHETAIHEALLEEGYRPVLRLIEESLGTEAGIAGTQFDGKELALALARAARKIESVRELIAETGLP